jgi:hypothetical protein
VFACTVIGSVRFQLARNVVLISAELRQAVLIGILVQRIHGKRLARVGRVPLGLHHKGRVHVHWSLRVNGHKLRRGRYLITLRALGRDQHVIAAARLGVITIY